MDKTRFAVGCGSAALCYQLLPAFGVTGGEVVISHPAFEAYATLTRLANAHRATCGSAIITAST